MSDPRPDTSGRFIGGLILAVGALVAFLSGACTLTVGATVLGSMLRGQGGGGAGLVLVLIVGGVPFTGGVALMLLGWSMVRPPRKPRPEVFGDPPPPSA